MHYAHNISDQSISVFFEGRMHSVPSSDPNYAELREHLSGTTHERYTVERLVAKQKTIARLSEGHVQVVGNDVMYKGEPIHSTLTERLMDVLDSGLNASIWARFMDRVMANPDDRSRSCLYDFLNVWKAPLTEDGCFIAFKRVRSNFRDIHSGTFDNSPGEVVEMPREAVDSNPDNQCSRGLHVAASSYLGHFATSFENKTVACKVDPADVCAVPRDYGFAKMRVCKYIVLSEAEESFYNNAEDVQVSYAGTAPATGELNDLDGHPICYSAMDFAENWRRLPFHPVSAGDMVSPSMTSVSEDLPDNRFMIGKVTEAEDGVVAVLWQDGTKSDALSYSADAVSDVTKVAFIGEEEGADDECFSCAGKAESGEIFCQDCAPDEDDLDDDDDLDDLDEDDLDDEEPSEMAFERAGVTYTSSEVMAGLKEYGQRGYSRLTGVPRTTLQDWRTKIEACKD